jgi:uncharacterized protein
MKDLVIKYVGLSDGRHEFDFKLGAEFFEELEYSEIESGDIQLQVQMDKMETMLILNFDISGTIDSICDHCAVGFALPVSTQKRLIAKITNEEIEQSEEIIALSEDEYEIDLTQFVYEFIALALPLRKTACEDEGNEEICDKEVIEKLENLSGDKKKNKDEVDPRWEALKKIKLDK